MINRAGADSTEHRELDAQQSQLSEFLRAQRRSVVAIIEGLGEAALRQTVVPSGWTPLGMIEHLAHAERFWFQHVVTGQVGDLPWPTDQSDDDDGPFASEHSVDAVLAFYRYQCERSDAVLSSVTLDAKPCGQIPAD